VFSFFLICGPNFMLPLNGDIGGMGWRCHGGERPSSKQEEEDTARTTKKAGRIIPVLDQVEYVLHNVGQAMVHVVVRRFEDVKFLLAKEGRPGIPLKPSLLVEFNGTFLPSLDVACHYGPGEEAWGSLCRLHTFESSSMTKGTILIVSKHVMIGARVYLLSNFWDVFELFFDCSSEWV
jgi:hypothetical protein